MTDRPWLAADPWALDVDLSGGAAPAHVAALLTTANGAVGWRGDLDEEQASGGAYLTGVFERYPIRYPEPIYGDPAWGERIADVPDGRVVRATVDGEELDLHRSGIATHRRRLDFRTGVLTRTLDWSTRSGRTVRITSRRLVSLAHRELAAVLYEVQAIDGTADVQLESELSSTVADRALGEPVTHVAGDRGILQYRLPHTGIRAAFGVDQRVVGPTPVSVRTAVTEHGLRTSASIRLDAGQRIRLFKVVAAACAESGEPDALRERVESALDDGLALGWHGLEREQRERLDRFWHTADVEVDGAPDVQQAVRFALFSVLQTVALRGRNGIPAKGLTGRGYEGHVFWDSETYTLPMLTALLPEAASAHLRWRHATLPAARRRAQQLHLAGAAFPWRTISGEECSGYWPAGTAAFHIDADIAHAAVRHARWTGDTGFEREVAIELLVETARLWLSLGRSDEAGAFHIDGVTGPDEYSALADDNLYTNSMARENLRAAVTIAQRHPDRAAELHVRQHELDAWTAAADGMAIPFDAERGIYEQSRGYNEHARWDVASTPPDRFPLEAHFSYFDLYRKQVLKQADLVLALHLQHDAFSLEEKTRAFAYYEPLTVRDSSLSASAQAVVAAEVGQFELAATHLRETASIDFDDLHHDAVYGLHLAALAGTWNTLVAGFGGMRNDLHGLRFAPRLPPGIHRLWFRVRLGEAVLSVEVTADEVVYRLLGPGQRRLVHFGEALTVVSGRAVRAPVPPVVGSRDHCEQPRRRSQDSSGRTL